MHGRHFHHAALPLPAPSPPPVHHPSNSNLREHYDFPWPNASALDSQLGADGKWRVDDLIVFIALESLGTLAITLNVCLCIVLLRHKYLHRASFVLMLSLALADVLHGLVTTSFFYPPILLRQSPVPSIGVRFFNILDWTAWSITLTHMSAICLDRLLAIIMYGRYNQLITVSRARAFTLTCWCAFFALNTGYILAQFCCLITPLRESHFYTFGYGEFESEAQRHSSPFGGANLFKLTYTPLELATIAVLSISNPITLIQLYRRHKRKMALRIQRSSPPMGVGDAMLRRASTMLLEVSMRMGSKHVNSEVQQVASRRASRQQQRILLQISVVAIIFYLYMSVYYLLYHVLNVSNKWVVLFNSFFYSTTHMINPVIYFSLNKDMRVQLIRAIGDFLNWICCVGTNGVGAHAGSSLYGRKRAESSSGSGLRKSSPGEPTSTAQPNSGWTLRTYRLPSAASKSPPWLLSPNHRPPSEKTPLLRLPSAPPPSTVSSSASMFLVDHHQDANNNGPLNNNTIAQSQHMEMVALAREVGEAVNRKEEGEETVEMKRRKGGGGGETVNNGIKKVERAASSEVAISHLPASSQALSSSILPSSSQAPSSSLLPASSSPLLPASSLLPSSSQASSSSHLPPSPLLPSSPHLPASFDHKRGHHQQSIGWTKMDGMRESSRQGMVNIFHRQNGQMEEEEEEDADDEMMELELVENWSVAEEEKKEVAAEKGAWWWRREALDGLGRLRGLGSFLAEQLGEEAAKQDWRWGRARRQRQSMLDALIRALVERDGSGDGDGDIRMGKKRNGLIGGRVEEVGEAGGFAMKLGRKKSHSFDFGHHGTTNCTIGEKRTSNSSNRAAAHHRPSLTTEIGGHDGMAVKYWQLTGQSHGSSSLERKNGNEEEGDGEEEEEIIFL